jgi:Protein of unknown function (DUF2510)
MEAWLSEAVEDEDCRLEVPMTDQERSADSRLAARVPFMEAHQAGAGSYTDPDASERRSCATTLGGRVEGGAMTGPPPDAPPSAGWLPDPTLRHELRYWDGEKWTKHVFDGGRQSVEQGPRSRLARTALGAFAVGSGLLLATPLTLGLLGGVDLASGDLAALAFAVWGCPLFCLGIGVLIRPRRSGPGAPRKAGRTLVTRVLVGVALGALLALVAIAFVAPSMIRAAVREELPPVTASVASDTFEPDGSMKSARALPLDDEGQPHTCFPKGDVDWIQLEPLPVGPMYSTRSGEPTIWITSRWGLKYRVLDASGRLIAQGQGPATPGEYGVSVPLPPVFRQGQQAFVEITSAAPSEPAFPYLISYTTWRHW